MRGTKKQQPLSAAAVFLFGSLYPAQRIITVSVAPKTVTVTLQLPAPTPVITQWVGSSATGSTVATLVSLLSQIIASDGISTVMG